jgi:hypothetical protein
VKRWIVAGVVALVLVSGVLALTWPRRAPARPTPPPTPTPQTVAVVKTDLTDVREFKATLGFGASQEVTGRRAGTLTWLPAPGTAVDRGAAVYKVDNRPVWLFFGDTPLWRKLDKAGTKGSDVKIVKDNLGALGYKLGGFASLEAIVSLRPDFLLVSEAGDFAEDEGRAFMLHPALERFYPAAKRLVIPERLTVCGGPRLSEALDRLASELERVAH